MISQNWAVLLILKEIVHKYWLYFFLFESKRGTVLHELVVNISLYSVCVYFYNGCSHAHILWMTDTELNASLPASLQWVTQLSERNWNFYTILLEEKNRVVAEENSIVGALSWVQNSLLTRHTRLHVISAILIHNPNMQLIPDQPQGHVWPCEYGPLCVHECVCWCFKCVYCCVRASLVQ